MRSSFSVGSIWIRVLLLPATAGLLGSCVDRDPTGPEPAGHLSSIAGAAPAPERGCARFDVRIWGKDRIEVVQDTMVECGSVQPVLAGVPSFDVTRKSVRLPVALENRGTRKLKAPARLFGWQDSLIVLNPPGLREDQHRSSYLGFVSPDSASSEGEVRAWWFDEQFSASGNTRVLAAGERSQVRWIEISAHPGVEGFRITLHSTALHASKPVPAAAPDTIPDDLYGNPAKVLEDSPYFSISNKVLKGIVSIRFRADASQEQRQEAIDQIGGEVIGGQPFPEVEGYYLAQVGDDGTGRQMREAIDQLNTLSQVAGAEPEYLFHPGELSLYLKPKDADSWAWSNDWRLDPTEADGRNWALEAISAPMAWGCNTGAPQTKVAVLDVGFLDVPDIRENVVYAPAMGRYKSWRFINNDHGTRVASVLAARGNNGQGITGVMWQAGLHLMDNSVGEDGRAHFERKLLGVFWQPKPELRILQYQLMHAIERDVGVINISAGVGDSLRLSTGSVEKKYEDMKTIAEAFRDVIAASKKQPLIVIAAGNAPVDAAWGVLPLLAADPVIWRETARDIRNQVIVVGGVEAVQRESATIWTKNAQVGSARNTTDSPFPVRDLVEIYAPATDIAVLAEATLSDWKITESTGTSFAAPLVAGVAGLLKSFDPSLTSEQIKELLIRGAWNGRRVVQGGESRTVYVVNAYESLKLAAQRPGAPLCGNRMWTSNGEIFAQRGNQTEALFRVDERTREINALHGGRQIRTLHSDRYRSFRYRPGTAGGTWVEILDTHPTDWPEGTSGAVYSFSNYSHDGGQRVRVRTAYTGDNIAISFSLMDTRTRVQVPITTIDLPRQVNPRTPFCMRQFADEVPENLPPGWEGVWETYRIRERTRYAQTSHKDGIVCHFHAAYNPSANRFPITTFESGAFSPIGDRYLYYLNYETVREQVVTNHCSSRERLYRNGGTDSIEVTVEYICRDLRTIREKSGADVYEIPVPGDRGWVKRSDLSEPVATLSHVKISEDGKEWVETHLYRLEDTSNGFRWHEQRRQWESGTTLNAYRRECVTRYRALDTGAVRHLMSGCDGYDDETVSGTFSPSLIPGSRAAPGAPAAAPRTRPRVPVPGQRPAS